DVRVPDAAGELRPCVALGVPEAAVGLLGADVDLHAVGDRGDRTRRTVAVAAAGGEQLAAYRTTRELGVVQVHVERGRLGGDLPRHGLRDGIVGTGNAGDRGGQPGRRGEQRYRRRTVHARATR